VRTVIVVVFLIMISSVCLAQTETAPTTTTSSAYIYSGPSGVVDQLKIYTYIWGQVRNPGLYLVPDNTDLLTLISLAGGPNENAKLTRVRLVRSTNYGEEIIWINLKDYIETGDSSLIPILRPGDTIVVSGTTFYAFSKIADFLSKVVIVLSVYNTIVNISD